MKLKNISNRDFVIINDKRVKPREIFEVDKLEGIRLLALNRGEMEEIKETEPAEDVIEKPVAKEIEEPEPAEVAAAQRRRGRPKKAQ